jgi:ABC-type multidrug transport system permease subunit
MLTRTVIATLAGATFPITIFPGWLQIIARLFPFTWAFDMERRSLLRGEGVGGMIPDLLVLGSMTIAMWAVGLYFLQPELRHVRKTGMLGSF